mmetsp:Transcript_4799/g.12589  ORF Transcript_4799/g.12589 Transcript_4799/m.12589 type:complete len:362 (-) Transcript_4799:915-2000(-)
MESATPQRKTASGGNGIVLAASSSSSSSGGSLLASSPLLRSLISGGAGGVAATVVGHPFDLVKVRMQTGMTQGTSVFAALRQTLVKEGIRGAYRGVSAPVVAISPVYALSFWGYELGQEAVRFATNKTEKEPCSLPELCFAGGLSAFPATMITAPSERIKCLLQIQTLTASAASPPKYTGMIDCAIQLLKTGGIRSLYKGFTLTLLRDVPGSITWFGVYEVMKSQLVKVEGVDDTKQLSIFFCPDVWWYLRHGNLDRVHPVRCVEITLPNRRGGHLQEPLRCVPSFDQDGGCWRSVHWHSTCIDPCLPSQRLLLLRRGTCQEDDGRCVMRRRRSGTRRINYNAVRELAFITYSTAIVDSAT